MDASEASAYARVLNEEAKVLEKWYTEGKAHYGDIQMNIRNAVAQYLRDRAKEVLENGK
jgi:hypothetical protein